MENYRRLTKSTDKWLDGVCGGLANYFAIDPTLVRIVYLVLTLFSAAFPGIILYLILMLFMPRN